MADKAPDKAPAKNPAAAIWIYNNEQGPRLFQMRGKMNDISKSLNPGPMFRVIPGANVVDAILWANWKDEQPDQSLHLLADTIPHMEAPEHRREKSGQPFIVEGPAISDRNRPLEGIDEGKCQKIIVELFDVDLLRKLLAFERRPVVADALKVQIDKFDRADAAPRF